ncbi:hypothetical protein [Stutzerimonas frequens]|uniref:hypothetical protein n=1 Tax=Stutzerimonas frequens TaxID=2968969 RepID=UPI002554C2A2|nr:hypothetical protein [Stutzerimonas frequens]MDL0438116.1 hypothetical protein [Stutzerimonas frequens]
MVKVPMSIPLQGKQVGALSELTYRLSSRGDKDMSEANCLIEILLDKKSRVDERDDAAMDLGAFDDESVLAALMLVGQDHNESDIVLASCGESIGMILMRRAAMDQSLLDGLAPVAKREATAVLRNAK